MRTAFLSAALIATVAGCGGTTVNPNPTPSPTPTPMPTADGAYLNAGTYSVIDGGVTTTLPAVSFSSNGEAAWFNSSGTYAGSFARGDVLAIGGVQTGTSFRGVSGTPAPAPTGNANFNGRYAVATAKTYQQSAPVTFTYNLASNSFKMSDVTATDTMVISATVSGSVINGTATYNGTAATLEGGFFDGNHAAGAFSGPNLGGAFLATR